MGGSDKDYSKKESRLASTSTRSSNSVNNNLNHFTAQHESTVTVDALNNYCRLVADTAATGHFVEMNASYLKKSIPVDPPITVLCPSRVSIKSTHTTEFNFNISP